MLPIPVVTRGPEREQSNLDILRLFVESPDPVLFAQEVSDEFGKSDEWARGRLRELIEAGYVNAKKTRAQEPSVLDNRRWAPILRRFRFARQPVDSRA